MDRVEASVARVVRVELKMRQPVSVPGFKYQAVKNARAPVAAVEVEIGRELLRLFVEDVQRAVQIAHEQPLGTARLFAQ